jgi:hypothetical protein
MPPTTDWESPAEWPKIDLPKRHMVRLALVWTVPFTAWAEQHFGELLDDSGAFIAALSYTRSKVLHYRVETARLGLADDDPLTVTVQYRCDTEGLPAIPRFLQEAAWLLDPLQEVKVESAVECHADFLFPALRRLRTVVPLPAPAAALDANPYAVDEIRGIRGLKRDDEEYGLPGYVFMLDRLANDDVALSVDFVQAPGPPEEAVEAAVNNATFIASRLARVLPRRKPAAAPTHGGEGESGSPA